MFNVDLPRAVVGFVGVHLGLRAEVANLRGEMAELRRRTGVGVRAAE